MFFFFAIFFTILKTYIEKYLVTILFAHISKKMGFLAYAHIYACSDGITLK